jgi:excisionase family DNA binding protein
LRFTTRAKDATSLVQTKITQRNARCKANGVGAHRQRNTGQNQILPVALQLKRAAQYLDVSEMSMRRLIKKGHIKANRILRHYLIPVAELNRFLGQ